LWAHTAAFSPFGAQNGARASRSQGELNTVTVVPRS